jgi:energy-coupling factor transport system substrate-specific component
MKKRMTSFEIILIALLSVLGVVIKPMIMPVLNILTDVILIPGGSVAGGFNIMWIVIGATIIDRKYVAIYMCFLQAVVSLLMGISGFHGILIFVTYMVPGIIVDFVMYYLKRLNLKHRMILAGALGNLCGSFLTNYLFFQLDIVPMLLFYAFAMIAGGSGGNFGKLLLHKLPNIVIKKERKYEV